MPNPAVVLTVDPRDRSSYFRAMREAENYVTAELQTVTPDSKVPLPPLTQQRLYRPVKNTLR